MKLTDEKAIKMLKRARLLEVEESLDTYPDNERDGRDDFQMIADEVGYFYSNYFEYGHCLHDALEEARRLLQETKYGKVIPIDGRTFKPLRGYWPHDIQSAKDLVNEFKRTERMVKRLEKLGYYSKWL